jgi:hypothetical protein
MVKRKFKKHHDWHHRKPSSLGPPKVCPVNDPHNLVHVSVVKHRAWHTLFHNHSAQEIARIITHTWIDPDYYMVAIPRVKSHGRHKPSRIVYDCEEFTLIMKEKR